MQQKAFLSLSLDHVSIPDNIRLQEEDSVHFLFPLGDFGLFEAPKKYAFIWDWADIYSWNFLENEFNCRKICEIINPYTDGLMQSPKMRGENPIIKKGDYLFIVYEISVYKSEITGLSIFRAVEKNVLLS